MVNDERVERGYPPLDLATVDSHCHAALLWYEPIEVLLAQMNRIGIGRATILPPGGQFDDSYQLECVKRFPDRIASVIVVEWQVEGACEELERLIARGSAGVRLTSKARSPGKDPYALWRTIERLGIPVSLTGPGWYPEYHDLASELAEEFPSVAFIVEHHGGHYADKNESERALRKEVLTLGRYPNCYLKIGGMADVAKKASRMDDDHIYVEPLPPYYELGYDHFGADRMMWGSNHPVVSHGEGYARSLSSARERYTHLPEEQQAMIFGGTANKLYFSHH